MNKFAKKTMSGIIASAMAIASCATAFAASGSVSTTAVMNAVGSGYSAEARARASTTASDLTINLTVYNPQGIDIGGNNKTAYNTTYVDTYRSQSNVAAGRYSCVAIGRGYFTGSGWSSEVRDSDYNYISSARSIESKEETAAIFKAEVEDRAELLSGAAVSNFDVDLSGYTYLPVTEMDGVKSEDVPALEAFIDVMNSKDADDCIPLGVYYDEDDAVVLQATIDGNLTYNQYDLIAENANSRAVSEETVVLVDTQTATNVLEALN